MTPRFCISEAGLPLEFSAADDSEHANTDASKTEDLEDRIQALLDLIETSRRDGQEVHRWSQLEFVEVLPGVPLHTLMYEFGRIDRILQRSLQATIRMCAIWDVDETQEALVGDGDVQIDETTTFAPSVAWVHARCKMGDAVACLCIGSFGNGAHKVQRGAQAYDIYLLSQPNDASLRAFYRSIPKIEDMDEAEYIRHARLMFPALVFKTGIAAEFRRFSGGYRATRENVTQHLAVLNDHFRNTLEKNGGDGERTARELQAGHGVEMSPESSNTKQNKEVWKLRKITIDGKELFCDWHTKISPSKDRIHFHPGQPGLANGSLIVGIFHEHLPT